MRGQRDLRDGNLVEIGERVAYGDGTAPDDPDVIARPRAPSPRGRGGGTMKVTDGAIRKHPMIFAFMVVITVMGSRPTSALPRESAPDVKIPFVNVIAPYPGTAPADMENLVTRKLERELKGLPDLEEMTSSSYLRHGDDHPRVHRRTWR